MKGYQREYCYKEEVQRVQIAMDILFGLRSQDDLSTYEAELLFGTSRLVHVPIDELKPRCIDAICTVLDNNIEFK
jgi:hypothetical protein